jgi:hypothetical protein
MEVQNRGAQLYSLCLDVSTLTNSELGNLGESELKTLAKRARMTPSSPDRDLKGWDLFLEWELSKAKSRLSPQLDRDHREVKALVQVKTSMGTPGSWSVKLSNWKSLVEYGGPSFFVGIEMEAAEVGPKADGLYVVHVGERLIGRYLERMRELDHGTEASANASASEVGMGDGAASDDGTGHQSGKAAESPKLHKRTMTVSFDGHALPSPTPTCLKEALEAPLERNPQEYISRKNRLIEEVGFEEDGTARIKGRIDFQAPRGYEGQSPQQLIADMILGDTGPVELTGGGLSDFRFGIPSRPRPLPPGEVEFKREPHSARLRFERRGSIPKRKRFDAQMLDGRTESEEGKLVGKVRFELPLGNVTFTVGEDFLQTNFAFKAPGEAPVDLRHYRDYIDFFLFLREAATNGEHVEVQVKAGSDGDNWNRFCLFDAGGDAQIAQVNETDIEGMKTMSKITRQALKAAGEAGLPRRLKATPNSLYAQRGELAFFEGICLGESDAVSDADAFFYFDQRLEESEHASIVGSDVALVGDFIFILGKYYLLLSYATQGKLTYARNEDVPHREEDATDEEFVAGGAGDAPHYYKIGLEHCFGYDLYVLEEGDTMPESSAIRLEGAQHLPAGYGPVFASEGKEVWIYSDTADLHQDLK